ncbi:MAG: hypothetical protein CML56_09040 [Rhodobacteraceae bacterium]|nr:hypothetical protein [Paracoccaceae bacterium]
MLAGVSEPPDFYAAMQDAFLSAENPELKSFLDALSAIDFNAALRPKKPVFKHATMTYLDRAVKQAFDLRFGKAARDLDWSQVYDGGGIDPVLAEGMLAAQFVGTYGRHPSLKIAAGLFLLAPGIHYPLHTHKAAEVYLCVSGRLQLRHGMQGKSFDLTPGQFSITPSGRVHELSTYSEPTLLAYIWIGDLMAPTWWWEQTKKGKWQRTAWERIPGEPWKKTGLEVLSDKAIHEASA